MPCHRTPRWREPTPSTARGPRASHSRQGTQANCSRHRGPRSWPNMYLESSVRRPASPKREPASTEWHSVRGANALVSPLSWSRLRQRAHGRVLEVGGSAQGWPLKYVVTRSPPASAHRQHPIVASQVERPGRCALPDVGQEQRTRALSESQPAADTDRHNKLTRAHFAPCRPSGLPARSTCLKLTGWKMVQTAARACSGWERRDRRMYKRKGGFRARPLHVRALASRPPRGGVGVQGRRRAGAPVGHLALCASQ